MLELTDLCRTYGSTTALDGLSLTVPAGKVVGFLGPNGAGKTTTMRAVFGVTALDSGQVRWRGQPITSDLRRGFGYMPEERGLYPQMLVLDQLQYLGRLHGMDAKSASAAATRWATQLGLGERLGDKVEELSLGNQQRVQLAAALVHDPELLVLDEPFSGLDPVGVDAMSAVLKDRAAAGVTVLFSSHQLDLVENLCDQVAIVHRGKLVLSGSVEELGQRGLRRLSVRVGGDPAGDWAKSLKHGAQVTAIDDGNVVLELLDGADDQAVLAAARDAGPVENFTFVRRHLSEVFRDAVGEPV